MDVVERAHSWNARRIVTAVFLGTVTTLIRRAFDFWPVGLADGLRIFLDLASMLLFLSVVLTLLVWLVSAFIDLCRRRFRRAAGSVIAILSVPACIAILLATSFSDPWVWYVVLNKSRFERTWADSVSLADTKFIVLEERDITTGLAGANTNHLVALIYSESDIDELAASMPGLRHVYGNFYRLDELIP